jgi:large subunit ribosomal protein L10
LGYCPETKKFSCGKYPTKRQFLNKIVDSLGNASPLQISTTSVTNYGAGDINTNTAFGDDTLVNNLIGFYILTITHFMNHKEIREKGGEVVVSKNTLLKLALQENNTPEEASKALEGQTVAILSYQDPLATIKSFFDFSAKVEKLKAKSGIFENKYLSEKDLDALSKLPSKQELIGKLVGSMKSPIFGLVNTLNQTQSRVVYLFKAVADKKSN